MLKMVALHSSDWQDKVCLLVQVSVCDTQHLEKGKVVGRQEDKGHLSGVGFLYV